MSCIDEQTAEVVVAVNKRNPDMVLDEIVNDSAFIERAGSLVARYLSQGNNGSDNQQRTDTALELAELMAQALRNRFEPDQCDQERLSDLPHYDPSRYPRGSMDLFLDDPSRQEVRALVERWR